MMFLLVIIIETRIKKRILLDLCGFFFNIFSTQLNISSILDSLLRGYDKRIRPNYGGKGTF